MDERFIKPCTHSRLHWCDSHSSLFLQCKPTIRQPHSPWRVHQSLARFVISSVLLPLVLTLRWAAATVHSRFTVVSFTWSEHAVLAGDGESAHRPGHKRVRDVRHESQRNVSICALTIYGPKITITKITIVNSHIDFSASCKTRNIKRGC